MLSKKIKYQLTLLYKEIPARNYLTVFEDDVFIASYPRSGNTWLRFLIGTFYTGQKVDWVNMEEIVPDIYRCSNKFLKKIPRPRLIKSHHPYDSRYNKVIYIIRDPRDVVISYFNWYLKFDNTMDNSKESFAAFFNRFMEGKISDFGTWKFNVESWINNKDLVKKGLVYYKYEELLTDTRKYLNEISDFLSLEKSDSRIDEALNWASFENMKKLEKEQKQTSDLLKNTKSDVSFVRSGKSGEWKEILTGEQLNRLYKEFGTLMEKFNYLK